MRDSLVAFFKACLTGALSEKKSIIFNIFLRNCMEKFIFKSGRELPYIASRQNARVVSAAKLADKKHREIAGKFLCEGVKLTVEASVWGRLSEVYIRESSAEMLTETVDKIVDSGIPVIVLSDSAFDKITTEKAPQGIISVVYTESRKMRESEEDGVILLLDSIRDPGNLGTILRSACALGGVRVVLHSCADLYNPKTVRAAMGAVFKTDITSTCDGVEYIRKCREAGRRVLAAALTDDSLKLGSYETFANDVIVIGNEGHGISPEIMAECSASVLIPMEEDTESLNASVAASVILWEYARGKN